MRREFCRQTLEVSRHSTLVPRVRVIALVLAFLVLAYHADHALANPVRGGTTDGPISISWEYDLYLGTGRIVIVNLEFPLDPEDPDNLIAFFGLLPESVTTIGFPDTITPMGDFCLSSAGVPLFADVPPLTGAVIEFEFPRSGQSLQVETLLYASVYNASTSACAIDHFHTGGVEDFVTVRPVPNECVDEDIDCDGDVDLQDYAKLVEAFTGPGDE